MTSDDIGMCEIVLIDHYVDLEKIHLHLMPGDIKGSSGETQGYVYAHSVDNHLCWY